MEFMPLIIGSWVIGMTAYSILNISIFKNKSHHRCNCKTELSKLKKFEKRFNESSKGFFE